MAQLLPACPDAVCRDGPLGPGALSPCVVPSGKPPAESSLILVNLEGTADPSWAGLQDPLVPLSLSRGSGQGVGCRGSSESDVGVFPVPAVSLSRQWVPGLDLLSLAWLW